MENKGTVERTSEPPVGVPRAELGFCIVGAVSLAVAGVAVLFDYSAHVEVPRGAYAILAAVGVIGIDGWTIAWTAGRIARRLTAQRRAEEAEWEAKAKQLRKGQAEVSQALAELTSAVGQIAVLLEGQGLAALPVPRAAGSASRRGHGHMYVAGEQGATVDLRASVDAATDPSGVALERAREEGVEKGFEIGLRAQLADRGIVPLQRRRRPRLTGDS